MEPSLTDCKIIVIQPNLDHPLLDTKEKKETLLKLLPKEKTIQIFFNVKDINPSIANYIRITAIDELPCKILDIHPEDVETNYPYIISEEIKSRLNYTPINQEMPEDAEFIGSYVSDENNSNYCYTSCIKNDKYDKYIHKKIRIAELPTGYYIKLNKIFISKGYGYEYSAFSITSNFRFKPTDFINIKMINDKLTTLNIMCKTSDVIKSIKSNKLLKGDAKNVNENNLENKIIIQVKEDIYKSVPDLIRLEYYDYVLLDDIPKCSSMVEKPKNYKFSFILHDTYDPKKFIKFILIEIINKLKNYLNDFLNNNLIITNINKKEDDIYKIYSIKYRESLYYLISYECYDKFSEIKSIKNTKDSIIIQHKDYKKILESSIKSLIKKYTTLLECAKNI